MKKLVMIMGAVALMSMGLAGCKAMCKKAAKYQEKLDQVSLNLAAGAANANDAATVCEAMSKDGYTDLERASKFAERVGYNKFFYTETKCIQGYWATRCEYWGGGHYHPRPYPPYYPPYGPGPGYRCYEYYQCTQYQTIEHKLDGFEDAMYVAKSLKEANTQVSLACSKVKEGNHQMASTMMAATRSFLDGAIKQRIGVVLAKAGCYAE